MLDTLRLQRLLQVVFAAQARDVALRLTLDEPGVPDDEPWVQHLAAVVRPSMLAYFQHGMLEGSRKLAVAQGRPGATGHLGDLRRYEVEGFVATKAVTRPFSAWTAKALSRFVQKKLDVAFDLFNPRVLRAVDELALKFCRETNATATTQLRAAKRQLRVLLKRGLERGDAYAELARQVRRIFADPMRAYRIAVTEGPRAIHGGELHSYKESGVVRRKEWVASSDACALCQEMADKGPIPLDEPFHVDPRGGPYAVTMHPPIHPHDFCTMSPVL